MCGLTLVSDGTTRFSHGVMNVALVFADETVVLWDLKETSGERKTTTWMVDFLTASVQRDDFKIFRPNLVTIVLDGAGRTAFKPLEDKFHADPALPNVICQWCSCHSMQLLLEGLADISGIDSLIEKCREYIKYVRNRDVPRAMLRNLAKKSLLPWCDTCFGTIFLCMARILEVKDALQLMVTRDEWKQYVASLARPEKVQAANFRAMTLDLSKHNGQAFYFFNRIEKVLQLTEPIFAALRRLDSNQPTVGTVYHEFHMVYNAVSAWEQAKFQDIDEGDVAFTTEQDTLVSNKTKVDTGLGESDEWNAASIVYRRWDKLYSYCRIALLHAAGYVLNPALYFKSEDDFRTDNLELKFYEYLQWILPEADADRAFAAWSVYRSYCSDSRYFTDAHGELLPSCSLDPPHNGTKGARWWFDLAPPLLDQLRPLRSVAIQVLSATSSETSAERGFSDLANVQVNNRARMSVTTAREAIFVCAETRRELAKKTDNVLARRVQRLLDVEDLEASAEAFIDDAADHDEGGPADEAGAAQLDGDSAPQPAAHCPVAQPENIEEALEPEWNSCKFKPGQAADQE